MSKIINRLIDIEISPGESFRYAILFRYNYPKRGVTGLVDVLFADTEVGLYRIFDQRKKVAIQLTFLEE